MLINSGSENGLLPDGTKLLSWAWSCGIHLRVIGKLCARAHFVDDVLLSTQIQWKINFIIIQMLVIRSEYSFTHATTA